MNRSTLILFAIIALAVVVYAFVAYFRATRRRALADEQRRQNIAEEREWIAAHGLRPRDPSESELLP